MIWSKLKKMAEAMLADSLRGRVDYHTTRYGDGSNNLLRRGWITFEGREIASFSNIEKAQTLEKGNAADPVELGETEPAIVFGRDDLVAALEEIVGMQVEDALSSSNPLIRGLAMLDRRLGKRRLSAIAIGDGEPELVKMLYRLQCRAEGIRPRS